MKKIKQSLKAGTRLDQYTIRKTLGGGGFSIVYLAGDDNKRMFAIKEYFPIKLAHRNRDHSVEPVDSSASDRFKRGRKLFFQEAQILSGLKHPNVVRVKNFFEANNTVYMVMPYHKGENLQAYISKHGRLSERFLRTVFPPLLEGLSLIHKSGFLHLDIKPSNVHLRPGGQPLLLDFGAVHRLQVSRLNQTGHIVTAGYSPIEQYDKFGYIGPWTDVYAVGATMRTCIEGQPPIDARQRYESDGLKPAAELYSKQYDSELLHAMDWCMEMHPRLRPQSADALLDALPRWESTRKTGVKRTGS